MIVGLCIGSYLLVVLAVFVWDAYIGFHGMDEPNSGIGIAAFMWPLILPVIPFVYIASKLVEAKQKRIAKALVQTSEREKEEIRLSLEIAALDMELAEETKQLPSHKGKGKWITNTY